MLAARHRLRRAPFTACFSRGRRWHGTYLQLITLPSPLFQGSVVVSKKVAKKAHARNRIRRQIYAALEKVAQEVPSPHAIIVLVKPNITTLSTKALMRAVLSELGQGLNTR